MTPENESRPDPARARFLVLNLVRLGGVALAFVAVSIMARRWVEPAELVGGALLVVAALDVLLVPRLLARRWRTPG